MANDALFGITIEVEALLARHAGLAPLYSMKRLFLRRRAMHKIKPDETASLDGAALEALLASRFGRPLAELVSTPQVGAWQKDEAQYGNRIEIAVHTRPPQFELTGYIWAFSRSSHCALARANRVFGPDKSDNGLGFPLDRTVYCARTAFRPRNLASLQQQVRDSSRRV